MKELKLIIMMFNLSPIRFGELVMPPWNSLLYGIARVLTHLKASGLKKS